MQINLNNTAGTFLPVSPIFSNGSRMSPYLSPLPNNSFRKYSYHRDDLMNFRLQSNVQQSQAQMNQEFQYHQCEILNYNQQQNDNCLLQDNQYDLVLFQENQNEKEFPRSEDIRQIYNVQKVQQNQIIEQQNNLSSHNHRQGIHFQGDTRIQLLIQYLVENIDKKQQQVITGGKFIYEGAPLLKDIFLIFLKKFKKSKKTKEEMTKYCMRRAFKFIADKMKRDRSHNRDIDTCMKIYFSKNQNNKDFTIPFKKNSIEKTMNGNFLKRIFSFQCFVADYRQFLVYLKDLIIQDNIKKVKYLAILIQQHLNKNEFKKIESIKRLPWTKQTLQQTFELGASLKSYSQQEGEQHKRGRTK